MTEFPSNSHKYKEEQKKKAQQGSLPEKRVDKVVTGAVKTRKKSGLSKFAENFISEDATSVKSYVFMEVLIPAIKKLVSDVVTDGISMILYGETGHTKKRGTASSSYVSYRGYYDDRDRKSDRFAEPRTKDRFDTSEIIFGTRGDAEIVLEQLGEALDRYGVVRVNDLYDLAGISAPYTGNRYGWSNIRSAEVLPTRDGYIIKMPRPMALD